MLIQNHIKLILRASILMGALFILPNRASAQDDSSKVVSDSGAVIVVSDNVIPSDDTLSSSKKRKHSPRIAVISSALIPGLGQVYNRKYWKLPIIYGAGVGLYFFFDYNNDYYQRLKKAYDLKSRDPNAVISDPDLSDITDIGAIERNRDNYRRYRDFNIIFMGLLYVGNIIDAMVDAHMYTYDISRDLTMRIEPAIIPTTTSNYTATCGLKVKFSF